MLKNGKNYYRCYLDIKPGDIIRFSNNVHFSEGNDYVVTSVLYRDNYVINLISDQSKVNFGSVELTIPKYMINEEFMYIRYKPRINTYMFVLNDTDTCHRFVSYNSKFKKSRIYISLYESNGKSMDW